MQIDRRNALKKLAAGGITAATASAVMSSPVFGDGIPIPPAQPVIVSASEGPPLTLAVTLSPGAATCDGNGSGVASVDRSQLVAIGIPADAVEPDPAISPLLDGEGTLSATFTITGNGPGDAVLDYRVVYRCTYASGAVDFCARRLITFKTLSDGSGWSTTDETISELFSC